MTRRERVRPLGARLDGALLRVEQPVPDREGAELVELDPLLGHRPPQCGPAATAADVTQDVLGVRARPAALRDPLELTVEQVVVQVEERQAMGLDALLEDVRQQRTQDRFVIARPPRPATTS